MAKLPNLDIKATGEVFLRITGWSTQDAPDETAGHAILNNGVIEWACKAGIVQAGGASVDSGTVESVLAAIQAGHDPDAINVQWHTHPTFKAFHSTTDDENEMGVVEPLARQSTHGSFYFIVVSGYDWHVRKYVWYDGVLLGYHEGSVLVPEYDIKLNQGRSTTYTTAATTTYNYPYKTSYKPAKNDKKKETLGKSDYIIADDMELKIDYNGELISIIYLSSQQPPRGMNLLQENDCIPLFLHFDVQPFRWDELSEAIWQKVTVNTDIGTTAAELAQKEEEKVVLLDAIVETFLLTPEILEDL